MCSVARCACGMRGGRPVRSTRLRSVGVAEPSVQPAEYQQSRVRDVSADSGRWSQPVTRTPLSPVGGARPDLRANPRVSPLCCSRRPSTRGRIRSSGTHLPHSRPAVHALDHIPPVEQPLRHACPPTANGHRWRRASRAPTASGVLARSGPHSSAAGTCSKTARSSRHCCCCASSKATCW